METSTQSGSSHSTQCWMTTGEVCMTGLDENCFLSHIGKILRRGTQNLALSKAEFQLPDGFLEDVKLG